MYERVLDFGFECSASSIRWQLTWTLRRQLVGACCAIEMGRCTTRLGHSLTSGASDQCGGLQHMRSDSIRAAIRKALRVERATGRIINDAAS